MLTLALLLLTPDVLDVDAVQGPYFEIRDAVAAAVDGDVVRVAPGDYTWFGVFGKSLTVASADPAGAVRVVGTVRVQSLAAGQHVVLDGLWIERGPVGNDESLILAANDGSVRIQDCDVDGVTGQAIRIQDCLDVTLHRTNVLAGAHYSTFFGGSFSSDAIWAFDSKVTVWDSTLTGSDASVWSVNGGSGLYGSGSDLFVHGTTASGGDGGPDDYNGFTGHCRVAGDGGYGVIAYGGSLRILDCALSGGFAGSAFECGGFGSDGAPYAAIGATLDLLPGDALTLECATLAAESSPYDILATGAAGDTILLVIGPDTGRIGLPAYTGDLHVGGPVGGARRTLLGVGSVQAQLQLPPLPTLATAELFLQTVHLRPGEVVFGPTRSLTILDSAW